MDIEAIVTENRALREREAALLERANLFQRSAEHLQRQVELLERSAALADKLAAAQRERIEMLEGKLETLSLELAKLKRQVTGPKSERRRDDDTAQASLFASEADPSLPAPTPPPAGDRNLKAPCASTAAPVGAPRSARELSYSFVMRP